MWSNWVALSSASRQVSPTRGSPDSDTVVVDSSRAVPPVLAVALAVALKVAPSVRTTVIVRLRTVTLKLVSVTARCRALATSIRLSPLPAVAW